MKKYNFLNNINFIKIKILKILIFINLYIIKIIREIFILLLLNKNDKVENTL